MVQTYEYVWAMTKVIFNYTGSPGEIIPPKVLRGLLFDSHYRPGRSPVRPTKPNGCCCLGLLVRTLNFRHCKFIGS